MNIFVIIDFFDYNNLKSCVKGVSHIFSRERGSPGETNSYVCNFLISLIFSTIKLTWDDKTDKLNMGSLGHE